MEEDPKQKAQRDKAARNIQEGAAPKHHGTGNRIEDAVLFNPLVDSEKDQTTEEEGSEYRGYPGYSG